MKSKKELIINNTKQVFSSFSWKLLFLIVLCSSIVTTIFTSISFYFDYTVEINLLEASLKQIEEATVPSLSNDLWDMNVENMQNHIDSIVKIKDMVGAWIKTDLNEIVIERGKETADYKYSMVRKFPLTKENRKFTKLGKSKIVIESLGELYVVASKENLYIRLVKKMMLFFLTQGIKTFVVSMLILLIFRFYIINHLEKISQYVLKPDFHDYHKDVTLELKRAPNETIDELDILVHSINSLRNDITTSTKNREEYLKVKERMEKELSEINKELDKRVQQRTAELKKAQVEIVEKARKAGMADVAKSSLHVIGNILNSASISNQILLNNLKGSSNLLALKEMNAKLNQNKSNLEIFLTQDKFEQFVNLTMVLNESVIKDYELFNHSSTRVGELLDKMISHLSHQREIILFDGDMLESIDLKETIEEGIRLNQDYLEHNNTKIIADLTELTQVKAHKYKILNVFTQIFRNAVQAMDSLAVERKIITINVVIEENRAKICIKDNGCGIGGDSLEKIFFYGYTTLPQHQGIGLHMAANYMREMQGHLCALSDGEDRGATFILEVQKVSEVS